MSGNEHLLHGPNSPCQLPGLLANTPYQSTAEPSLPRRVVRRYKQTLHLYVFPGIANSRSEFPSAEFLLRILLSCEYLGQAVMGNLLAIFPRGSQILIAGTSDIGRWYLIVFGKQHTVIFTSWRSSVAIHGCQFAQHWNLTPGKTQTNLEEADVAATFRTRNCNRQFHSQD